MIRPADLNRRITIQHKRVAIDPAYGTEIITWVGLALRIGAQVQGILPSKSESVVQGIRVNALPSRVRIRYTPGITSDMRVVLHNMRNRPVDDLYKYFFDPLIDDRTDIVAQIVGGPTEIAGHCRWLEMMVMEYSTDD